MKTVNIIKIEKLFQEIQQVFDNRRKNIIQSFSWSLNIRQSSKPVYYKKNLRTCDIFWLSFVFSSICKYAFCLTAKKQTLFAFHDFKTLGHK